jgi:D-alanyl-D-alanine carboxypeptidase
MTKVKLILLVLMSVWMLFATERSYGRYAAILIDADNGNLLHEVDATQSWYPASLTKLMTLYMTFEALKNGQIQFFDAIRTSSHAASQPTSKLGLRSGEYLTVRDAVLAIITRSANDAAVVLGEHLGGTEENFAVKMTGKAHSLGMYNTRFMNATGLPNDWQVTTSRDMAVLAWNIQRHFPEYYQNFSAHSFNYKGRELRGINKFTAKYPGAEGMKTGFTCGSGYNLIASAHQNGKRLIGVVMGGMTSAERYQLMYAMMDAGFENRYGSGIGKHINSMPSSLTGPPPYQLGCGSRGYLHTASIVRSISHHHGSSRRKFISKSTKLVARPHVVKSRQAFKTVKSYKASHKVNPSKRAVIKKSASIRHKKIIAHTTRATQSKRTRYHHHSAR